MLFKSNFVYTGKTRDKTLQFFVYRQCIFQSSMQLLSTYLQDLKTFFLPAYFLADTVFPHIVSSLEYFPPLNSFLDLVRKLFKFLLHKGKINEETIWNSEGLKILKKNSCRGKYMRKYGRYVSIKKFESLEKISLQLFYIFSDLFSSFYWAH